MFIIVLRCSLLYSDVQYCTQISIIAFRFTQMFIIVLRCSSLYSDVHCCTRMFIIVLCPDVHYCTDNDNVSYRSELVLYKAYSERRINTTHSTRMPRLNIFISTTMICTLESNIMGRWREPWKHIGYVGIYTEFPNICAKNCTVRKCLLNCKFHKIYGIFVEAWSLLVSLSLILGGLFLKTTSKTTSA
jgi:hypothetical protein